MQKNAYSCVFMKEAIIMAVFKCKMCGGSLEILSGESVAVCEYCNTKQTVPAADDEKKMNLFMRANRLRFTCEFDKAAGVYESIVADFPEESEAYWGLLLCQYGIEYVDDPLTAKKIPTCHRSSFESVFDNDNFELVMEYSDSVSRAVYRDEAKQIEELRKGIIEVSAKEAPYDIFICYKETADNGERTIDSVIAQDIYNELTEKGYRVFFSRITLEDKLGQEYEPYIFAALNSAKLMLVFGTDYEYFNAVWVKNEWSRFLQLIAKGEKKTLIPCYKNIDAYDMPKEFAKLQAQDMGKVGAVQDLLRGIEKIIKVEKAEQAVYTEQVVSNSVNTEPLLRRAFMFLEDGDFRSADEYCEKVLDADPENVNAYLGKLMAETGINKRENLRNAQMPFDKSNNYQKILRFGDDALKKELTDAVEFIYIRKKNERIEGIYTRAVNVMKYARIESAFREAAQIFESVLNYKDSAALAKECYVKAEEVRKDSIYNIAVSNMMSDELLKIEEAKEQFISIRAWRDSEVKISECDLLIAQIEAELEVIKQELQDEKKKDIIWSIILFMFPFIVIAVCIFVYKMISLRDLHCGAGMMIAGEHFIQSLSCLINK